MKTISEQLKELGLSHGDLCEIEKIEGRHIVCNSYKSEDCFVMLKSGVSVACEKMQVTCGWKAADTATRGDMLNIRYERVIPALSPTPKPLPESVEASIKQAIGMDVDSAWRRVTSALLAEVDKRIEAAKPKGTLEDIVGVNPVYGPKRN